MEDLVIVGAGPAGMTAGVYAARKGLNPLVISSDIGGQAIWSSNVENYMGFKDIHGSELMQRFEEHMKAQRLRYVENKASRVTPAGDAIGICCESGEDYSARAVIVATGKRPRTLDVPGERELRGKGVSYCSTCDGPLFREVPVAVVGGGNAGLQACFDMLGIASEVHLVTEGRITADQAVRDKVLGHEKLKVHENHRVVRVEGDRGVTGLRVVDNGGRENLLSVEGVFVEIGLTPNSDIVPDSIVRNRAGEVEVDCDCRTNVTGLFAAGDVSTAPGKQIIIAAGEGAKAALAAYQFLSFG